MQTPARRSPSGSYLLSCDLGHGPQPSTFRLFKREILEGGKRKWGKRRGKRGDLEISWWSCPQPKIVTVQFQEFQFEQESMSRSFLVHGLVMSKTISACVLLHCLFLCLTFSEKSFNDVNNGRQKKDNA